MPPQSLSLVFYPVTWSWVVSTMTHVCIYHPLSRRASLTVFFEDCYHVVELGGFTVTGHANAPVGGDHPPSTETSPYKEPPSPAAAWQSRRQLTNMLWNLQNLHVEYITCDLRRDFSQPFVSQSELVMPCGGGEKFLSRWRLRFYMGHREEDTNTHQALQAPRGCWVSCACGITGSAGTPKFAPTPTTTISRGCLHALRSFPISLAPH